jgi:hypothetical protein
VFAYSAQPYSLSFLLLGWAWVIATQQRLDFSSILTIALVLFVAIGINPSVILICGLSFIFFYASTRKHYCFLIALLSLISFGFWQYAGKSSPDGHENYSQLSPELLFKGLSISVRNFTENTETLASTISLFAVTLLLNTLNIKNTSRFRAAPLIVLVGASALVWWVIFSMSSYVSSNEFHFRYFFPSILALLVIVAITLTDAFWVLKQRASLVAFGAVLSLILYNIIAPYKPMAVWHSSGFYDGVGQYVRTTESRILTGGYWQVWPALFRIQSTDNRRDAEGRPWIYVAASRGKINRPEMDSLIVREIRQGRTTTAVCIGGQTEQCLSELSINTSFSWQFVEEGNCLTMKCYLFRVKND